ncbi:olfactomedin-4-like [Anomaloglossus baeobatrachus]|uniref:olfactomedin-4-like n=1 Tax=Anomaloglossus baeobatrachus TaxID=238106 RepID=UPI003F4FC5B7
MSTFLLLLLGICQAQASSLIHDTTGSQDELGVCHCSVLLSDSTFPADRFEMLEISNQNLTVTVEEQIMKIHHYETTLDSFTGQLLNLTRRVEVMEMGGLSYTKLDFELVNLEIREMEALILQVKNSMNDTDVLVEALHMEIRNISIMVRQLEVYDKNNVLVIRREIAALRKRLEDYENHKTQPMVYPPGPHIENGAYHHGYILSISKPVVVQLNYLGFGYRYGGWGRDSLVGADQNALWVAPLNTDGRLMNMFRMYDTYDDLQIYNQTIDRVFNYGDYGQGGGMIMYNGSMYYNCYTNGNICKYNPDTNRVELIVNLPNAAFNNRFSYSSSPYQDIDMASDQEGLWAIYSTELNVGNIVISKLDPISLEVIQTWATAQHKPSASNAFMARGVLYVTRAINTKKEDIFYIYDTKTEKEGWLSIPLEKPKETVQSLSYNPNDQKLYMYNDGYLVTYDLIFQPLQENKSKT